jgi:hypothetical protein
MNISELSNHLDRQENRLDALLHYASTRAGALAEEIERLEANLARLESQLCCRLGRLERALPAPALSGSGQVLVIEGNGLRP